MNFIPILMSGESDEIWFESEDEAWEYIYSRSCKECKKDRKFDMCSAEWDVWTKEEFEHYNTETK
jgi:hypothetical protein